MLRVNKKFLYDTTEVFDKILQPQDIAEYELIIDQKIAKVIRDGKLQYGELLEALNTPRRGWLVRGMHPAIAETTNEHNDFLLNSIIAYTNNPQSDVSQEEMEPLPKLHDITDGFIFDIIPSDKVVVYKEDMELYAIQSLYTPLGKKGIKQIALLDEIHKKETLRTQRLSQLDKADPEVNSRQIRNTFEEVRKFYQQYPHTQEFLLSKYPGMNLEQALEGLYEKLGEFRENNKNRIKDPFLRVVLDQIEEYTGADTYREYFNLLSSLPMQDIRDSYQE